MRTRWFNFLVLLSLILGLVPVTAAYAASETAPVPQVRYPAGRDGSIIVDEQLTAEMQLQGAVDFFIWMREQADLEPAYAMRDRNARRIWVYETLRETAERSQAGVRARLDRLGYDYEIFIINNSILVRGGTPTLLTQLAARNDIYRLLGNYTEMYIPEPEQLIVFDAPAGGAAVASDPVWNISIVNADAVWELLDVTGAGVVVANIDTGVQYTHPALENNYRGNLGGGNFSHAHNWLAPTAAAQNPAQCGTEYNSALEPCDSNGHGTHTMGTSAGGDGTGPFDMDVGMAPDAKWMACMGCDGYYPGGPGGCSSAALTACAEWMLAPSSSTTDHMVDPDPTLAPDVVNNSWGGGVEDPWYLSYVTAWRAADIIPVFSAGNNGPGCSTLGSPGSYENVLSVGGTDNQNRNYTFTSRGPGSGTGVFPVQKPDIAAPGEGVRSAVPGNGYANYSGTSMAAPHVTGLVALLRSVNPALDYDDLYDLMADTAYRDLIIKNGTWCGGPEEGEYPNYVFGYGRIDAYAAVETALAALGDSVITGEVLDAATNATIAGATILATNAAGTVQRKTTSNTQGIYVLTVFSDTYTLEASHYGYQTTVIPDVVATTGATTTQHIAMTPAAFYEVSGQVTDATTGWPLYAQISITGDPVDPVAPDNAVWTDPATGAYSVMLAEGVTYTFEVAAWSPGYDAAWRVVAPLTTDATEDFALQANMGTCTAPGYYFIDAMMANFEDAAFPPAGWTVVNNGGACEWAGDDPGGIGNMTGGTGKFAIADSDTCGIGTTMNTDLISPPFDVSGLSSVILEFAYDYRHLGTGSALVDVSADNGPAWANVVTWTANQRGPATFSQDITALVNGSAEARVRFRYLAPGWYWWWQVDNVMLGNPVCVAPTDGGLVVGNVYDANYPTVALNGAEIVNAAGYTAESVPTPLDDAVDDGFYTVFAPSGTQTFTATTQGGYGADVVDVTVVDGDAVAQDFFLPAGLLSATPDGLDVTVELGYADTRTLDLTNTGGVDATFELAEKDRGFGPLLARGQGMITWLAQDTKGISISDTDSGATVVYPGAYLYTPVIQAPMQGNILVYTDDWVHTTPNTLVQQALARLGLAATVYVDGNYAGFEAALTSGGPWDVVIWSGENSLVPASTLTALRNYLQAGGKLAATYWQQLAIHTDPLWAEMGFTYISNYVVPPPAYWWDPAHPIFNNPESAPEWLDRVQNSGTSQGTRIEPLDNGIAIAGYTTGSEPNEAGIVIREDGMAVYKALRDVSTTADADGDGVLDGVELWQNIITGLLYGFGADVPWLDETPVTGAVPAEGSTSVTVDFDAAYVDQPGEYHAELIVKNDTPYGQFNVPVTMTVVAPNSWGKLTGTVTGLGVCDGDPALLEEAEVLVESATTGQIWAVTTGADGVYHLWLDQAHSPLTITVTAPDYFGETGGVVVVQGETTVVDFDLRLLKPCLSYDPADFDVTLPMGGNTIEPLTLSNTGAGEAEFELVEFPGGFMPMQAALQTLFGTRLNALRQRLVGVQEIATGDTPQSLTEFIAAGLPAPEVQPGAPSIPPGALQGVDFYYDRGVFNVAHPGLPVEGYENGTMPNASVNVVPHPLDEFSNNAYFDPGDILSGIQFWATNDGGGEEIAVLGTQFMGNPSKTAVANAFADSYHIVFAPPVQAAGMDLQEFLGGYSCQVDVYDFTGMWLGSDVSTCNEAGAFWGVASAAMPIGEIVITSLAGGAQGADNIAFGGESPGIPWVFEDPITGTIAADTDTVVDLTFDAGVPETMQPGTYYGQLRVSSNAANEVPNVPLTLTVTAPDTWGKLMGEVTGLGYCDVATPTLLAGAKITVESGTGLFEWLLEADENGVYQLWMDAAHSPLTVTVAYPDHVPQVFSNVVVVAGATTVRDAALRWAQPCLTVEPGLFDVTVTLGMSTTVPFSLTNWGAEGTAFDLTERNGGWVISRALFQGPAVNVSGNAMRLGPTTPRSEPSLAAPTADVIQDGSFEDGTPNAFWNEYSSNFGTPICDLPSCGTGTGTGPRTGDFWVWFGGINAYEEGSVDQDVTIPAGIATLSFWLEQIICGSPTDYMQVLIDGNEVFVTDGTSPLCGVLGYSEVVVDVTDYADGSVHNIMLYSESAAGSNIFVDDVVLDVLEGVTVDIPWLFEDPESGTVDADSTFVVNLTFDASDAVTQVTQPGEYFGALFVNSDDPVNGSIPVPVTMTVTPPATWGKLMGTVTSLGYCDADPAPVAGVDVLIEGSSGMTWTLTTNVSGTYQLWLDESHSPITVTVEAPAHERGEATGVTVSGGVTTTQNFDLRWLVPCVGATPAGLHATLELGATATEVLTLTNTGAVDTDWDIEEENFDVVWLAQDPLTGTLVADTGMQLEDVAFDASVVDQPGEYYANLWVNSDDPFAPIILPVTMTVTAPASWGELMGTVYSLGRCDEELNPLEGAEVVIWDDTPAVVATLPTDAVGAYHYWLPIGDYTVTVAAADHVSDYAVVTVPASGAVTQDFSLTWLGPCVTSIAPSSMEVTMAMGMSETLPLTMTNVGAGGLDFWFSEQNGGFEPSVFAYNLGNLSTVGSDISASPKADNGKEILSGLPVGTSGQVLALPNPWVVIPPMPTAVSRPAGAAVDGKFYVLGGEPGYTGVQVYDPAAGTWSAGPAMPTGVSNACAAVIGTDIYIPGSGAGVTGAQLQVFHIASNTWETITSDPLPSARVAPACAAYEGKLYVFAGGDDVGYSNTAWVYDPAAAAGSRWSALANTPISAGYGGAITIGDNIFWAGMRNAAADLADVYAYNVPGNSWVTYPNLPAARGGAGLWAIGDLLYVGGGGWSTYSTVVYEYDTSLATGGSWSVTNPLIQGRRTFAWASSPETGRLYVGAGWAGAYLNEAEETAFPPVGGIPWLFEDPESGAVPSATAGVADITFDAGVPEVTQPGTYAGVLTVNNNDPVWDGFSIPVTMHVTLPETYGQITGTVMGLGPCDDPLTAVALEGAAVTVESAAQSWTLFTGADGGYALWLDEAHSPVTITVAADGYVTGVVTGVQVISDTTQVQDFDLAPNAPCAYVTPETVEATLTVGMSTTVPITIGNTGIYTLSWMLSEEGGVPWLAETPTSGDTAPGETSAVTVTFDAADLMPGEYTALLALDSVMGNTPIVVPVTLTVEAPATWGRLEGLVQGLGYCDVMTAPIEGAVVLIQSSVTETVVSGGLEEDFEGDDGGFVGALDWEWGTYNWVGGTCDGDAYPPPAAHSGNGMWGTVLNDCYNNLGDTSILSFEVDLSDALTATLSWWDWYDVFETFDYGEVYVNGIPVYDRATAYVIPTAWEQHQVDLTPYVGDVATVEFRMYATTVVNRAGWYIDDVRIETDVMEMTERPVTWLLTTDATGTYGLWLDELYSPLTVTISYEAGYDAQVFTNVAVISDTVTILNADLLWLQPCIAVAPDALALSVSMGTSTTVGLNLANMGAFTGSFLLNEWSLGFEMLGIMAAGGPDSFGYRFADSNDAGIRPVYDFVDISGIGTPVALGDNDFAEVDIGFDFKFYGASAVNPNVYDTVFVGSNGFLSFGAGSTDFSPDPVLPDPTLPNNLIAVAWDDLVPGTVYVQSFAQCPYNPFPNTVDACFIVQYDAFTHAGGAPAGTWEVILFRSGSILMQYADVDAPGATTGIEGPLGLDGLNYGPALADELAICFAYPGEWLDCQSTQVPWLETDVDEGVIAAYDDVTVAVTFDASVPEVAAPGDYLAWLVLQTNDPFHGFQLIPVTMTVEMPATMGKMWGTIYAWNQCDVVSSTMANATVLIESSDGQAWMMYSNAAGEYGAWLPVGETVTMTVSADGYVATTIVENVTAGVMPAHDVNLRMDKPCINVAPTSYDVTLPKDRSTTRAFSIHNTGAGDFAYNNILGSSLWLSVLPKSGVVPGDSTVPVTLTFDATGLVAGDVYSTVLQVIHTDPDVGLLLARPVRLTVLDAPQVLVDVVKTVVPADFVLPGDLITYTVVFTNSYDMPLDLTATDPVPANTTYVLGSVSGATMADPPGNVVTWAGSLEAGTSATFSFIVRVNDGVALGTMITNTVTVTANDMPFTAEAVVRVGRPVHIIYLPLVMRNVQ